MRDFPWKILVPLACGCAALLIAGDQHWAHAQFGGGAAFTWMDLWSWWNKEEVSDA